MSHLPPIPQAPDAVPGRRTSAVIVVLIATIAGAVGVAVRIEGCRHEALSGPTSAAPERVAPELSGVDTTLIGTRAPPRPDAAPPLLRDWGWVDREQRVVRMPLDVAARVVAAWGPRHRVPGDEAPGPGPTTPLPTRPLPASSPAPERP